MTSGVMAVAGGYGAVVGARGSVVSVRRAVSRWRGRVGRAVGVQGVPGYHVRARRGWMGSMVVAVVVVSAASASSSFPVDVAGGCCTVHAGDLPRLGDDIGRHATTERCQGVGVVFGGAQNVACILFYVRFPAYCILLHMNWQHWGKASACDGTGCFFMRFGRAAADGGACLGQRSNDSIAPQGHSHLTDTSIQKAWARYVCNASHLPGYDTV